MRRNVLKYRDSVIMSARHAGLLADNRTPVGSVNTIYRIINSIIYKSRAETDRAATLRRDVPKRCVPECAQSPLQEIPLPCSSCSPQCCLRENGCTSKPVQCVRYVLSAFSHAVSMALAYLADKTRSTRA